MVTGISCRGVSICALVGPTQVEQSCYERAFQELYDGNHQQLHFVLQFIEKVQQNVLCDEHRLLEFGTSVLKSFG